MLLNCTIFCEVFDIVKDEARKHIEVKYAQKCTACKKCLAVCKFDALELVNRK